MDVSLSLIVTQKAVVMLVAISVKASTRKYERDFEEIVQSVQAI